MAFAVGVVALLVGGYLVAVLFVPRTQSEHVPVPILVVTQTIGSESTFRAEQTTPGVRTGGLTGLGLLPLAEDIRATFKCEDVDPETGQEIGPTFLSDLSGGFLAELDWMRRSQAKKLAATKGWRYGEDC